MHTSACSMQSVCIRYVCQLTGLQATCLIFLPGSGMIHVPRMGHTDGVCLPPTSASYNGSCLQSCPEDTFLVSESHVV